MSFDFSFRNVPAVVEIHAAGFPSAAHPVEPDLFCRQIAMPGHDQQRLEEAHVAVVGCGGLGSWIALGIARLGVRRLTLVDSDVFDRSNGHRQLVFGIDIGEPKAHALGRNVVSHMTNSGVVRTVALPFQEALPHLQDAVTALLVGVDNNQTRLDAARFGLASGVPIVFCMLSRDGLRAQIFRQEPKGPCLSCVLPNFDHDSAMPCAAASIASCFMAASQSVGMLMSSLMGRSLDPTWRETSLDGSTERTGRPPRMSRCLLCSCPSDSKLAGRGPFD